MKRLAVFLMVLAMLAGCSSLRELGIKASQEEVKNVEAAREMAKNYLVVWPMQSGIIRGALGDRISVLPKETVDAMDKLDDMATGADWGDHDLGYSLGLRVRMLSDIVLEALKTFAPDVITTLGRIGL